MSFKTIEADPVSNIGGAPKLGQRNGDVLNDIFKGSPISKSSPGTSVNADGQGHDLKLTAVDLKSWFFANVVNGVVKDSGAYYGANGDISVDFNTAPDTSKVKFNKAGDPASPYVPNLAPPGAIDGMVNVSPSDSLVAPAAKVPTTWGSGATAEDSSRNPSVTSAKMNASGDDSINDLGISPASV